MPESLGRYLRRERQMRDVTLEQISAETKIKLAVLEALEEDRFEALPSPAIVKGFLRSYADIVGLSGQSLVLRYESILEEQGGGARAPLSIRQRLPRKPRRLAPVIWLLLVVLALGVGIRFLDDGEPETTESAIDPEIEEVGPVVYRKNYLSDLTAETRSGTPAHVAATSPRELGPPAGGVQLVLRATAPVTLRVVLDRGEAETLALAPGQAVARYAQRAGLVETDRPDRVLIEANGRPVSAGLAGGGPVRFLLSARPVPPAEAEEGGGALPPVGVRVVSLLPGGADFTPLGGPFSPD